MPDHAIRKPRRVSPEPIAFGASVVAGIAFGVIPARKASRLNALAVLCFEQAALGPRIAAFDDMESLRRCGSRVSAFVDSSAGPRHEELPPADDEVSPRSAIEQAPAALHTTLFEEEST